MTIGVIDSGIGGFTVLWRLLQDHPQHAYMYLADQAHLPYSEKPPAQLVTYMKENVSFLLQKHCDLIVVACNTATVHTLSSLRELWPNVPFVGTVPAVKTAASALPAGAHITILATHNTAHSLSLQALLSPFQGKQTFSVYGLTDLVQAIEAQDWKQAQTLLSAVFQNQARIDGLVLGCTHFPLVLPEIRSLLPKETPFFTPDAGISDRVATMLQHQPHTSPSVEFFSTLGHDLLPLWRSLQLRLNLIKAT